LTAASLISGYTYRLQQRCNMRRCQQRCTHNNRDIVTVGGAATATAIATTTSRGGVDTVSFRSAIAQRNTDYNIASAAAAAVAAAAIAIVIAVAIAVAIAIAIAVAIAIAIVITIAIAIVIAIAVAIAIAIAVAFVSVYVRDNDV
jgi:ABC-type polysaccharide/polyol phosphate export permease